MSASPAAAGDVAIVGAGIIGLSIARELAVRGADVRVYDTGEPARAASWAAAGMLAPITERIGDAPMLAICERSLALYPEFVRAVRDESSVDPHLRVDGILHAAYDAEGTARNARLAECLGSDASLLDRMQSLSIEPALSKSVAGSLLVHGEGHVDNRRLGRALAAACEARGVRIHTNVRSVEIEADARRVLGVRTDLGYVAAGAVVNAAGAWAANILGVPPSCVPPVRPVKGQMLAIAAPAHFFTHAVWVPGGYFVPRSCGRLLVGATSEEAGYDTRVTAGGLRTLLDAAIAAAPALGDFAVTETWAGLRPATPDERPFLGPTPLEGYFMATGHYRNGILLAPVTARLVADAVEGARGGELEPFSLDRLGTKGRPVQRTAMG